MKLRIELQKYLDKVYPASKISRPNSIRPYSIFGDVHIRFELGGVERFKICRDGIEIEYWKDRRRLTKVDKLNLEKHYQRRAAQATARATTLFNETFENSETDIWILVYEDLGGLFNHITEYLFEQFPPTTLRRFYDKKEQLETLESTDENGIDTWEKFEARVIIGKVKLKDIQAEKILNGIANNEMGFDPNICQKVYFFDPITDRAFHMYDDRGCYVWSDRAEKIKYLYDKRNEWIVDYHRPDIDKYFAIE